ncbi:MAG: glutamyl-tRNA reductase, partial [Candidatus Thermoplasmatota archaeon]|nr:glutamyl-tRNA reductase [Candidatus Thermoplasmatota archaeon]
MIEVVSAHITHKWVDIKKLELYAAKEAKSLLNAIKSLDSVQECALLKTCNRVEVYVATEDAQRAKASMENMIMSSVEGSDPNHIQFLFSVDSVRHLARVASGLESMIVGEEQILSQVKDAYSFGLEVGTIDKTLGEVFRKAISIGKKVRSETGVSRGSVSIGSAAVELANGLLESLQNRTILVVGAGEISQLVALSLARHNVKTIFVANRTYDDAVQLAARLGGEAVHF